MSRRTVSAVIVAVLLTGIFAVTFNIQPAKSDHAWTETIYIRADGSIQPSTAPISTVDNVTYTLTDNIVGNIPNDSSAIIIERDNIMLDGAGYTLQGIQGSNSTGIELGGRSNVAIRNMNITAFNYGIYLGSSSNNNSVSGNNITANTYVGIEVDSSSINSFSENNMSANSWAGIYLDSSSNNNSVSKNNITANHYGIYLIASSNNNSVTKNNITANSYGITLISASDNKIYHNNVINNTSQVYSSESTNVWDDGYPSGGNYWDDYLVKYPNATEIDASGIGNTPYVIDENNTDNYPLMKPSNATARPAVHDVAIDSVVPHQTRVLAGDRVSVDVAVENRGTQTETFSVTGYYSQGKTGFESSTLTLNAGETTTVHMSWNTSGIMPGIYPIGAYVSLTPGETNSGNNDYTDGTVTVLVSTSWNGVDNSYSQGNYLSLWSAGGNCYGLSSTTILYFKHYVLGDMTYPYFPAQNPPATSTSKLILPTQTDIWGNVDVLNNASLAVMFHQVYDPSMLYLVGPSYPIESTEYDKLVMTLESGIPAVMEMMLADGSGFHAVVAYAIQPLQDGTVNITLSNPTYPQKWEMANYNPSSQVFSYIDPGGHSFDQFEIRTPGVIDTTWFSGWDKSDYRFFSDHSWGWQVSGYDIILASKPITVESVSGTPSVDSFTSPENSTSFVCGISGSSGIEEGSVQVYAIPSNIPYTILDPSANQTTIMISHVESVSGQLAYSEYLLNASTTLETLNFTVKPSNTGIAVTAGTNALNVSVSFFYATEQNFSSSQVSDTLIELMQTANFTVSNWQRLNETGIQITPEFPDGALGIIMTLSVVLFVALATVIKRRKIGHRARHSTEQVTIMPSFPWPLFCYFLRW